MAYGAAESGWPTSVPSTVNCTVAPPIGDLLNTTVAYARERLDLCDPYTAITALDMAVLFHQPYITCSGESTLLTARVQNTGTAPAKDNGSTCACLIRRLR